MATVCAPNDQRVQSERRAEHAKRVARGLRAGLTGAHTVQLLQKQCGDKTLYTPVLLVLNLGQPSHRVPVSAVRP